MNALRTLVGRWLDLPAPRCRAERSFEWVRMPDGTRLATTLFRPVGAEPGAVVLIRTVRAPASPRRATTLLAQLLAEQGHVVATQQCRGLGSSEGRFEPFLHDGEDGAATLDWLTGLPGCGGPLALLGFGYGGHAAFATLARSRRPIAALIVGFTARDPFAWLHRGGALELSAAFELALSLAAAEPEGVEPGDVARALRLRPVREADRIAARRIDWLREWLDHPERDAFWESRAPALPERAPQALLLGGFQHATLSPLLEDHAALARLAERQASTRPRLVVGPGSAAGVPRRGVAGGTSLAREIARETAGLLDRIRSAAERAPAPVRVFVQGRGWRETSAWPAATDRELVLHLGGNGREEGALRPEPPGADAAPDTYVYDPADAPHAGADGEGRRAGAKAGAAGDRRGDALRYASEPQASGIEIVGSARVELFASSDAPRTDFTALLLRVARDGSASTLAEGIARVGVAGDAPTRVEIELSPCWQRIGPGERLGLEIASSGFPRFDRHPNTEDLPAVATDAAGRPARQRIHHDAAHASRLRVNVLAG